MTLDIQSNDVGVRLQNMGVQDQTVVLARLAQARLTGVFSADAVRELFDDLAIPPPRDVADVIGKVARKGFVMSVGRKQWQLTPIGRQRSLQLFSELDLAAAAAEASVGGAAYLGQAFHTVVPPALAPPELILPLQRFLSTHPFETNIFGMTRYPSEGLEKIDLIGPALEAVRSVCKSHGFDFHLASDGAIHDNLWTNVAGHMWGSRYGIAFFENTKAEGLNHNLTIEVGSMLMTGRRCALLKDKSVPKMPTDLVGQIYKDVNLEDTASISESIHLWFRDDLGVNRCRACPPPQ